MKRFYFTVLSLLCIWAGSNAQTVLLDQNFESGALPSGWTRQQSTPSRGWTFGTATNLSSSSLTFPAHTKFAASNDDKYDNQAATANLADRDMLITPALNLTTLNAARLSFDVYHTGAYGSTGTVEVSADGGATWSPIHTIAGSGSWRTISLDLTNFLWSTNVKIAFVHDDGGLWADGVAIDDVLVFEPTANDVQLVGINMPTSAEVGGIPVTIVVQNFGTSVLNSFSFSWTADGGTTNHTETVNGAGIQPGTRDTITHNAHFVSLVDGSFTIDVKLDLPNGQTDYTMYNNSGKANVDVLLGTAERFVLVEQHTGAWCQFCPDGAVRLKSILDANPDVIGIAIHNRDGMDFTDGNTVGDLFVSGYPSGTVDRVRFTGEPEVGLNRTAWNPYALLRKTVAPSVAIEATNTYNAANRQLTVDVSAQFLAALSGEYRVNVFIVEDSVTGTGGDYDQVNAYNGQPGHPYYQAGNPIKGFVHRHVARHFMGGAWGQANVIPNPLATLTPYSHTFTYTLPANWNADRIKLVAVVQKFGNSDSQREILNALEMDLNTSAQTAYEIVNNPAAISLLSIIHSECGLSYDGEISVEAEGCSDCIFTWSNGLVGNLAYALLPGTYTVTMSNNAGVSVTQDFVIYGSFNLNPTVVLNNGSGDVALSVTGGTGPYTISWSNGNSGPTQTGLAQGIYTVTVVDAQGCSNVQTVKVGNAVGINDIMRQLEFNIYPNPTSGTVMVAADFGFQTDVTIEVFNTLGALVSTQTLAATAIVNHNLDLTEQANGIYIVKVTANGESGMKRLVLNR